MGTRNLIGSGFRWYWNQCGWHFLFMIAVLTGYLAYEAAKAGWTDLGRYALVWLIMMLLVAIVVAILQLFPIKRSNIPRS